MDSPATPPMLDHVPGEEIHTEDKQAIRQLYKQTRFISLHLSTLYNVGESTINRVLRYDQTTRERPTRTGRPHLLNDAQVNWIIEWLSETYRQRTLNWTKVYNELKLNCTIKTLEVRLK